MRRSTTRRRKEGEEKNAETEKTKKTSRYLNPPYAELAVAAEEHIRIAEKRLRGMRLSEPEGGGGNSGESGSGSGVSLSPAEAAALRTETLASHVTASSTITRATTTTTPSRPPITTHVLDTALGRPAAGVRVRLLSRPRGAPAAARAWVPTPGSSSSSSSSTSTMTTDNDGRCSTLLSPGAPRPPPGHYRIEFDVGEYFERTAREVLGYGGGGVVAVGGGDKLSAFYPTAAVEFVVSPPGNSSDANATVIPRPEHLHIPLTFSPFGYSTYRGS